MIELQSSESARQDIQHTLDAAQPGQERNRLGQFATPPVLARQIAEIALSYHGGGPIRFLEPSVGSGAFYEALLACGAAGRIAAATGVEVDPRFVAAARGLWGGRGLSVVEGDFTEMAPSPGATLILANPPYTRHHHLDAAQKAAIQAKLQAAGLGGGLSGLSGLYLYFVLLADAWAAPGCVSAWLLPSEWMDVNYGAALRAYLGGRVRLLRLHRFRPEDVQFGDALVTSSVVFFRHERPDPAGSVLLTSGRLEQVTSGRLEQATSGRLEQATSGQPDPAGLIRAVPAGSLDPGRKWGGLPGAQPERIAAHAAGGGLPLGRFLEVRRGIATGGNAFFVRSRSEFRRIGIADRFLRPLLPPPRGLSGAEVGAGAGGWPDLPDPPALLDCRLPEASLAAHPALRALLTSPEAQAIREGYLCSHRAPWYLQEQRPPAPIVATYMGRSRDGAAPIRFVRNRSAATATNNWLLLSPAPGLIARFPDPAEREAALDRLCGWLDRRTAGEIGAAGRTYGGGLSKMEPKELATLDISDFMTELSKGGGIG